MPEDVYIVERLVISLLDQSREQSGTGTDRRRACRGGKDYRGALPAPYNLVAPSSKQADPRTGWGHRCIAQGARGPLKYRVNPPALT